VSYLFLGALSVLASHLAVATALSLVVAALWPALARRLARLAPSRRATTLFALGVLPACGGLVVAIGLVVPAWLVHEPRHTAEAPRVFLMLAAGASAVLGLIRIGPGLRDHLVTARAVARWSCSVRPLPGMPLPAVRITHDFPVAVLAGIRHPRLLVADQVVEALTDEELKAVAAHELGHVAARDNLKSLLLRVTPDPLALTGPGRDIRRAWEAAAELAADRHACSRTTPLTLASALLRVAVLVPRGRRVELAAFHRDDLLSERVRSLVGSAGERAGRERPNSWPLAVTAVALAVVVALAVSGLSTVHRLLESIVHL
jgi:Zn-dependent protease with chaperone function